MKMHEHLAPESESFFHGVRSIAVRVIESASLCVANQPPRLSRSPNIITHARGGRTTAGPRRSQGVRTNALTLVTLMAEVVRLLVCLLCTIITVAIRAGQFCETVIRVVQDHPSYL